MSDITVSVGQNTAIDISVGAIDTSVATGDEQILATFGGSDDQISVTIGTGNIVVAIENVPEFCTEEMMIAYALAL